MSRKQDRNTFKTIQSFKPFGEKNRSRRIHRKTRKKKSEDPPQTREYLKRGKIFSFELCAHSRRHFRQPIHLVNIVGAGAQDKLVDAHIGLTFDRLFQNCVARR
jgi:hypothetical protein